MPSAAAKKKPTKSTTKAKAPKAAKKPKPEPLDPGTVLDRYVEAAPPASPVADLVSLCLGKAAEKRSGPVAERLTGLGDLATAKDSDVRDLVALAAAGNVASVVARLLLGGVCAARLDAAKGKRARGPVMDRLIELIGRDDRSIETYAMASRTVAAFPAEVEGHVLAEAFGVTTSTARPLEILAAHAPDGWAAMLDAIRRVKAALAGEKPVRALEDRQALEGFSRKAERLADAFLVLSTERNSVSLQAVAVVAATTASAIKALDDAGARRKAGEDAIEAIREAMT